MFAGVKPALVLGSRPMPSASISERTFYKASVKCVQFVKCSPVTAGIWQVKSQRTAYTRAYLCPSVIRDPVNGSQAGKGECTLAILCHISVCDTTAEELKGFTKIIIFLNIAFAF